MKTKLLSVLFCLLGSLVYSQQSNYWTKENSNVKQVSKSVLRTTFPAQIELLRLNFQNFQASLQNTPDRFSGDYSTNIVEIPNSQGQFEKFRLYEASNFDEELQNAFPEIRSYVGEGIDNPGDVLRLSISPSGIQTMTFKTNGSNEFIEKYSENDNIYAVYKSGREKGKLPFTCSTDDQGLTQDVLKKLNNVSKSSSGSLLTFRLALSCTAEYSNYFGATNASQVGLVLAAFNNTMARVNGVFEKDFAIHMNIIAASTNVIYYSPNFDPYSVSSVGTDPNNANNANGWNIQLQNTLSTSLTGASTSIAANNAAYDIGHLFGADGGGGNAGCIGCVCTNDTASTTDKNKGSGYTSPGDGIPLGDNFDIDYVAHEMGHQFGANHTFSMSFEGSGANMEVGSGSTIMGYAGITAQNVQAHSDDYFHAVSIAQVQTNMVSKTCPTSTALTHGVPVVNAGADYIIPRSTPFMLTGSATDVGGGTLTYCWEQYDVSSGSLTGANSAASATKASGPNWKSYTPTTNPTRYFPNLQSVFAGQKFTAGSDINIEYLSSVARTLNYRLTVRDNVANGGLTNFDNAIVTVDAARGPLEVTSQNTDGIVWTPGNSETVTWTVNNTNTSAGGSTVDILYTSDNGLTWTPILTNTPNDGSQAITVPSITEPNCRIMVKASGNIFFNVNTKNIAIGNYVYENQNVCEDYTFNLNYPLTESSDTSYPGINLPISDSYTITDIKTYANITHPSIGQVNILFWFPWSTGLNTGIWYNQSSCTNANMDKWFDLAGTAPNCTTVGGTPFLPFSSGNFTAAIGQNSAGTWRIYTKDVVVDGSAGVFNTFTIQLCRSELVPVLESSSFETNDFVIYPNPNNGEFNLELNGQSGEVNVFIHDLRGRLILRKDYSVQGILNAKIEMDNTQAGIYLVTVQDGSRKITKKIIVE